MSLDKLVDSTQLDADLTSVANAIRTKGGTSAALAFPAGFVSAIDAIPTGGQNIDIGISSTSISNILNMFAALENGTAATGEFTLTQSISNTEELFLSTGLPSVNGFFVADESKADYQNSGTPENVLFSIGFFDNGNGLYACTRATMSLANIGTSDANSSYRSFLGTRCTWRWDGGTLYLKGAFNHNANYTPFYPGHTYRWVAW